MSLFKKKRADMPHISLSNDEPVIRCSICTGEQVLCARNKNTGQLTELMLIRNPSDLAAFCEENGIPMEEVQTIY